MAANIDTNALQMELKRVRVCRFCLSREQSKLTSIYMRDTRIKTSAPLPIQIMAIASMEVYSNDGMPTFVCSHCTSMFEYSYQFKQMCKKADTLLRQYPLTGKLAMELEKPTLPMNLFNSVSLPTISVIPRTSLLKKSLPLPTVSTSNKLKATADTKNKAATINPSSSNTRHKILNSNAAATRVPTTAFRTKIEKMDDDELTMHFLEKIENNDEISIEDLQQLVGKPEKEADTVFINDKAMPVIMIDSGSPNQKPKLLNKSSMRILNKEANKLNEPRLSLPKIKQNQDGNTEIVAEILGYGDPYDGEPDPKNAEPIETNVFPCPQCERSFPLKQLRDIHMKNHTRDRNFLCEECDKSFFSKYDLQRHSFTHNGEKPFRCSACDKGFSRSTLLQRHEKTHIDVPKFICIHCERPFISKEEMEKHVEKHNKKRPFQCKMCDKAFAFKQGLERHEVIHSRNLPHACQYCDLSFSTTTKLSRHLTAHAGQRPYPCKFCNKSFLLSHHLTRHLRSHRMESGATNNSLVTFMCISCDASFTTRDELVVHSSSHANENNLSCPLCKETYANIEELTAHIKEHSQGDAYACEFCDLIFLTNDKLQLHIFNDHVVEMEAYYEDDRNKANKIKEHGMDMSNEDLQNAVNEFLTDESGVEDLANAQNSSSEFIDEDRSVKIKKEAHDSPKIINQIIISSGTNYPNTNVNKLVEFINDEQNSTNENSNAMIPLKKIKLENLEQKVKSMGSADRSKMELNPVKRKLARASTIATVLKQPVESAVVTKSNNNKPSIPSNTRKPTASSRKSNDNTSPTVPQATEKKLSKFTITRAEAAAMAKDGRIHLKDGRIVMRSSEKK